MYTQDLERFQSHVHVDLPSGCHIWAGAQTRGYGQFSVRKSREERRSNPRSGNRRVQAHKWIFEYHYGQVEKGLEVDHKCLNPSCVNVEHLQKLTKTKTWRSGAKFTCKFIGPKRNAM